MTYRSLRKSCIICAIITMDKYVTRKTRESKSDCASDNQDTSVKKAKTQQEEKGNSFTQPEFCIEEVKGDLFSCREDESLAHCISQDVRMGKGIAVIFKKKFGGVAELLKQGQKPGGVAVLERDKRFVYYLVTKEKYWNKPTYSTLRSSLEAMREHCVENKVTKLSMPRIGCGLDGLQWNKVFQLIKDVFQETSVKVTVYTL